MSVANPKVSIIILNWNGKKDTLECLTSVEKIPYKNRQTIVVDNGSRDDSVKEIRKHFPNVIVLETEENLGYAQGNNVGIEYALKQNADAVFLLNNDTIVDPDIVGAFVDSMKKSEKPRILGAKIFLYDVRDQLDHLGGKWNAKKGIFELIGHRQKDDEKWQEMSLDYVCGCALFIPREIFDAVGFFEEKFFVIWEESDFCMRAKKEGFESWTVPMAKVWHKVSASFSGKTHSTYFWWRNRLLWIERNCGKRERFFLWTRVMGPNLFHILKLWMIKSTLLQFMRLFRSEDELIRRKEQIGKYKAALNGAKDYLLRRFGNGPAWIYKSRL